MTNKYAIAFCILGLSACTSVPQQLDPKIFYKRDMVLKVNGFVGEGTLVVPKSEEYKMEVNAKGVLDMFTLESCHRETSKEDAGEPGLFGNKKKVVIDYRPVAGLEDTGSCPVFFGGYERKAGRHSWGVLDFETDKEKLPAVVRCNGSEYNSRGVTICQSKAGLLQEIIFPVAVEASSLDECKMQPSKDGQTFRYEMPRKECVFNFMEKAAPHREHRLTTFGYESILIRDN